MENISASWSQNTNGVSKMIDRTLKNFWFSFALASLFCIGLGAFANGAEPAQMQPPVLATPDTQTEIDAGTFNRRPPEKKPPLGEGLSKQDVPKFVFGASLIGLAATIAGAVVKLGLIVAFVFLVVHFTRNLRGKNATGEKKDAVDALIGAFDDLVTKVNDERAKHIHAATKLGASLNKLKSGVVQSAERADTKDVK